MAKFTNFHPLNRKERIALIVLLSIFAIFSVAGIASFNSKTVDSKTYTSLEEIVERKYYYKQKAQKYITVTSF